MRIAAALVLVLLGCGDNTPSQDIEPSPEGSIRTRELLEEMPVWFDRDEDGFVQTADFSPSELATVQTIALELQDFAVEDIRRGIAESLPGSPLQENLASTSLRARIFVLLRVLFAVPETVQGGIEVRSPFASLEAFEAQDEDEPYPILWPVVLDSVGSLSRIHRFRSSSGPGPHQTLDEFDWLSSFGFRILNPAARMGQRN